MSKNGNGMRVFEDRPAVREEVPLMIGLGGPSGSGKTFTALRLASGIQRVTGGETFMIDSEARRSLHYADKFKFRFVPFDAPFSPLDYRAAIEHCVARGARQVIIDSTSHEHEGPGGVLEWHAAEQERLSKAWSVSMEKAQMPAWTAPKQARRAMINYILQQRVNFIFCFRAKDKIKPNKQGKIEELGWTIIGAEELYYEMTVRFLLYPQSGGVPTLVSADKGERNAIKIPDQFASLIHSYDNRPLDENIGEEMARWAAGDVAFQFPKGKHKGKLITEVPDDYLEELLHNDGTSDRMAARCNSELERRKNERDGDVPEPAQGEQSGLGID